MANTIILNAEDGKLHVRCPYSKDFVSGACAIGGGWKAWDKVWEFDAAAEPKVRDLLIDVFGTDGTPVETVTVRVAAARFASERDVVVAGRSVAWRPARTALVVLAEGVTLVSGEFPAEGGTTSCPTLGENTERSPNVRD